MNAKASCVPLALGLLLLAAVAAGCRGGPGMNVGDTGFIAFEGKQERWPIAEHALVDRDMPLPVYRGLPPRSYIILGRIVGIQHNVLGRALAEGFWSDRDRLRNVCAQARIRGADAVLLAEDPMIMDMLRVPRGEAGENERPLYSYGGAVVAIRWAN